MAETARAIQAEADGDFHDAAAYLETSSRSAVREIAAAPGLQQRPWRTAKSLEKLRSQVNAAYPGRSKASDGTIGDTAHCPGSSDHCPNVTDGATGVVTALDITHDPGGGCDMHSVTEAIRTSQDSRVKYVIWNARMFSSYSRGGVPAWQWRPYGGVNPHQTHAHVSVVDVKAKYDDTSDWKIE